MSFSGKPQPGAGASAEEAALTGHGLSPYPIPCTLTGHGLTRTAPRRQARRRCAATRRRASRACPSSQQQRSRPRCRTRTASGAPGVRWACQRAPTCHDCAHPRLTLIPAFYSIRILSARRLPCEPQTPPHFATLASALTRCAARSPGAAGHEGGRCSPAARARASARGSSRTAPAAGRPGSPRPKPCAGAQVPAGLRRRGRAPALRGPVRAERQPLAPAAAGGAPHRRRRVPRARARRRCARPRGAAGTVPEVCDGR
jgi:hypothetical protein